MRVSIDGWILIGNITKNRIMTKNSQTPFYSKVRIRRLARICWIFWWDKEVSQISSSTYYNFYKARTMWQEYMDEYEDKFYYRRKEQCLQHMKQ